MSGICGVWDSEENIDKQLISSMVSALSHRGKDDSGIFLDKSIGLGQTRFNTIDIKSGRQPVYNEDGTLWIVFSGEFYNFIDERAKLMEKGHRFYTNSDAEVVLHLYEECGSECVLHMNGQFAFAIYDSNMKRLFLARDRLGIKPLVYFFDGRRFAFASEIKSLIKDPYIDREISHKAVNDFFSFGFIPAPDTIFKNIKKLPPAHTLLLQQNKMYIREYWDVDFSFKQRSNISSELKNRLKDSVRLRLVADVPIAVMISGDVESAVMLSAVSKTLSNIRTYSIHFEDDDPAALECAKKIAGAFGLEHKEFLVKPPAFDMFAKLVYYLDEPFADSSVITDSIASAMAARNARVILSSCGSEELFAGTELYTRGRMRGIYSRLPNIIRDPVTFAFSKNEYLSRHLSLGNIQDEERRFFEINSLFASEERHRLLNNPVQNDISLFHKSNADNLFDKKLYADIKFILPNQVLKKADTSSMFSGIESRFPYLDHTFVEFAVSVPSNKKLRLFENKHILRRIAADYLPKDIISHKKHGSSLHIAGWFRSELKDTIHNLILGEKARSRNYFEPSYIERLWEQHQAKRFDRSKMLFSIASFELWHRLFIDSESPSPKELKELL